MISSELRSRLDSIKYGTYIEESYYGKNEILLQCESLFQTAIYDQTKSKDCVDKISKLLTKMLNFNKLVITTIPVSIAMTVPLAVYKTSLIGDSAIFEKSPYGGIQFASKNKIDSIIFIDLNWFESAQLTGAEAVSIILHEIGHSLEVALPQFLFMHIILMLNIPAYIIANLVGTKIISIVDTIDNLIPEIYNRLVSKINKLGYVVNKLERLSKSVSKLINGHIIPKLTENLIITNIIRGIISIFGYKNELISDKISASYGYGQELISALAKLDKDIKHPITDNAITRLLTLPYSALHLLFDPHPNNITRFKSIIDGLEEELKKSISPDAIEMIKHDIDAARVQLDNYNKQINNHKFINADLIVYRKIMTTILNGHDDIRSLFLGLTPKDMVKFESIDNFPVNSNELSITECSDIVDKLYTCDKATRDSIIDIFCK